MIAYKGADNVYWLFSSSAQAIAAFIGFLAAGFFFSYDLMDKQVEKDETLEVIYVDIKNQYFKRLKALFILTGFSILLSLGVVFINGYDFGIYNLVIAIIVGLVNVVTVVWAITFVIFIIDPDKVKKTVEKLIKEDGGVFEPTQGVSLTRAKFLESFTELETLLRDLAKKYKLEAFGRFRDFMPLGQIIRSLYERGAITRESLRELSEMNKIRNLVAHGEINNIEQRIGDTLNKVRAEIKSKIQGN
ncbi:hypothetical protein SAMN05421821_11737 [Mucilaginibacter lappiensis]|uniref:RiboL-PSP-HEPN domain-containing protein n=1 Tax=Mucilaginibacter lappiensis TaxID=354630 RepID=A0ABR6PR98_9SPHI|nr:hypothetical protein [Mucilaginibacter lappiensis]MBB6112309.1 hypothetical protein [Mucilaginibacter lappiensis]SIR97307.1 hypothetical protein SAMN05421821_11737 [Mucilaginibacter lappiensis]